MTKLSMQEVGSLALRFSPEGIQGLPKPLGGGHINDTYLFEKNGQSDVRYVLQRINRSAFPEPEKVMENIARVTGHLKGQITMRGGDPDRETLNLHKCDTGKYFTTDRNNDYWRCYTFVSDSISLECSDDEEILRQSGHAFGRFLRMLEDFDASTLHETIAGFHDTPRRFANLHAAITKDAAGRAAKVKEVIDEVLSYESYASKLTDALGDGRLPLRVTHNDAKLGNVLLDAKTKKAVCVIDLDTVMPGLSAYDYGDSIRVGACTAAEDEANLDLVHFSFPLFQAYTEGYLQEVAGTFDETELLSLPIGAKIMILESAVRFLEDYLNGDVYFKCTHPKHNLDRTMTQVVLLRELDACWQDAVDCVMELGKRKG